MIIQREGVREKKKNQRDRASEINENIITGSNPPLPNACVRLFHQCLKLQLSQFQECPVTEQNETQDQLYNPIKRLDENKHKYTENVHSG